VNAAWTLGKNEETRLGAFGMKGLRKILWVSWTANETNELVLNKAEVMRELLTLGSRTAEEQNRKEQYFFKCSKLEQVRGQQ